MHPDALAALPGVGQNAITRRAGGRLSNKPQPKRIVVDVREFMGSLPAVLHQQGLEIVPVTLEVSFSIWPERSKISWRCFFLDLGIGSKGSCSA